MANKSNKPPPKPTKSHKPKSNKSHKPKKGTVPAAAAKPNKVKGKPVHKPMVSL
jgi:hypothetical protein